MTIVAALRAEFAKIFTVRLWWVLLLVLVGYVALTAGLLAVVFGGAGQTLVAGGTVPQIPQGALAPVIYSIASSIGYVFPVLFGMLSTTTEFRHQTLTPTFLATPRRAVVLGAKFGALAVTGAGYGIAALAASVGLGAPVLAAAGHDTGLGHSGTWLLLARIVLAMSIWAIIGVGLGALIPSQAAAIVIVLAFTQLVEPILRMVATFGQWAARIGQYLPGAASDALVGASIFTTLGAGTGDTPSLDWWAGGLILVAYAVLAGVFGYATSWRRDVT